MRRAQIERGWMGAIPYAAVGAGQPLVLLAGLSPVAGEAGDGLVRSVLAPVGQLASQRRLVVLNRWAGQPPGLTMSELAAWHAEAIRGHLGRPVDVVGVSTGGSIAQQLAADHPDTVQRLALVSTACRLGPAGREMQARVAALLRAGSTRQAVAVVAGGITPAGVRTLARAAGWAAAHRVITGPAAAADLIATIDAEDAFDLAACEHPIQARTLIIAGARDRYYSPGLFEETAALIPRSQLQLYPRRGHITVTRDRRATANLVGFFAARPG